MRLTIAALLLALLAGCNGGAPGVARDGGSPGPDGGKATPARACQPIPAPPGEWQPVQAGRPNSMGQIMSFEADTLFVVDASFDRLLRSDDRGATWCFVPTPVPVLALFTSQRRLYAIAGDPAAPEPPSDTPPPPRPPGLQPPPPSRVLFSDDGGDSWSAPGGVLPRRPQWVFPWSKDPQELVALVPADFTTPAQLWLTSDGGASWHPLKPEGRRPEDPLAWSWIARHPTDAQTLVALAETYTDNDDPQGPPKLTTNWLWTSTDEGQTWARMSQRGPFQDALLRDDGSMLGLTTSGDVVGGGLDPKSWTTLGHLALLRASFLAGRNGGLYVQGLRDLQVGPISTLETADGGRTWSTVSDEYVQRIPLRWWEGTSLELSGYGVRATDDGGKTWRNLLLETRSTGFTAGGGVRFFSNDITLLRSSDEAGGWTGTPFFDRWLASFLPHPTIADTAYAVLRPWMPGGTPSQVRTRDGGKSWQPLPISAEGQPLAKASIIAVAPTTPPVLFAAGDGALVRSADDGATWSRLQLPSQTLIRVAPSDPNVVYAASYGFISASTNGGVDWDSNPLPFDGAGDLVVDPANPKTLYIMRRGGPISASKDGGLTWKQRFTFAANIDHPFALSTARPDAVFYVDTAGYIVEAAAEGMQSRWHRPPGRVSGLGFDPAHPEVLYLSTSAGAFMQVMK